MWCSSLLVCNDSYRWCYSWATCGGFLDSHAEPEIAIWSRRDILLDLLTDVENVLIPTPYRDVLLRR